MSNHKINIDAFKNSVVKKRIDIAETQVEIDIAGSYGTNNDKRLFVEVDVNTNAVKYIIANKNNNILHRSESLEKAIDEYNKI